LVRIFVTFVFFSSVELVARKQGHCAEKASAGKEFQPKV
jgi:hypothetical protein